MLQHNKQALLQGKHLFYVSSGYYPSSHVFLHLGFILPSPISTIAKYWFAEHEVQSSIESEHVRQLTQLTHYFIASSAKKLSGH